MPRYFLHVRDGDHLQPDQEGETLRDLEAARAEALNVAREMLAEAIRTGDGRDYVDAAILITDERGAELATVPFFDALPPGMRPR